MKRILFILMSVFTFIGMNAQTETALKNSKFTDNVFIGVSGGASWSLMNRHDAFWENVNPMATVKIGKYATPKLGLQVEFEGGFNEGHKTFLDRSNLSLDGLFNLSNIFAGYKGSPRTVEFVGLIGAGWFHDYDNNYNSSSAKAGVEINFNLGKAKAWQINVVPAWTYLPSNPIYHSYASVSLGVTYKFKNSYGGHNFKTVNVIDEYEWNSLNEQLARFKDANDQLSKQLNESTRAASERIDTVYVSNFDNVVSFRINSANIDDVQMANLSNIAYQLRENPNVNVTVKAYADKKTGSDEYNQKLSEQRAEAVKKVLVEEFNIPESRITTLGVGSSEQFYDENDWNRVAIFVTK